jgi:3-hydroxymyristoyl/3-hydroxydecanoyl-(acyl carrier protein) dehydratase
MGAHFCAFSFVDRIVQIEPGVRALARYVIPSKLPAFPIALVAESVGQAAAWVAMAATDFRARPVAGLGGRIHILGSARPGQVLDVSVELDRLDDDAIAYRGCAQIGGTAVLQLDECVGPMLPADQFDDPAALRGRFDVLCGADGASGDFDGVDPLPLRVTEGRGPQRRATLCVPAAAPFFADHFPRRPVLPGTLLLDAMFRLACLVAHDADPPTGGAVWSPATASGVKIRTFIAPGTMLDIDATLHEQDSQRCRLRLGAAAGGKSVASARVEMQAGGGA